MCKCKIQWVDKRGKPTPDDNDAIGMAVCRGYYFRGEWNVHDPVKAFPICREHYADFPTGEGWEFMTFEDYANESTA